MNEGKRTGLVTDNRFRVNGIQHCLDKLLWHQGKLNNLQEYLAYLRIAHRNRVEFYLKTLLAGRYPGLGAISNHLLRTEFQWLYDLFSLSPLRGQRRN